MNLSFTETQQEVGELAHSIFEREVSLERLREIEASDARFDRALWAKLAASDLLGLGVPEAVGGLGVGLIELGLLHEAAAAYLPAIPLGPVTVASLALARFGGATHHELLAELVAGRAVVVPALTDAAASGPMPALHAAGGRLLLNGGSPAVPFARVADHLLVSAAHDDDRVLVLVDARASGVAFTAVELSHRVPAAHARFADVAVTEAKVLGRSQDPLAWLLDRQAALLLATTLGVVDQTVQLAAAYGQDRVQFGVPIGNFQAFHQRIADAWIDVEAIRLLTWQALWRMQAELPYRDELQIARAWVASHAYDVVRATAHLMGGMGVDVDGPHHRYYLWAKGLELALGPSEAQLERLGESITAG